MVTLFQMYNKMPVLDYEEQGNQQQSLKHNIRLAVKFMPIYGHVHYDSISEKEGEGSCKW